MSDSWKFSSLIRHVTRLHLIYTFFFQIGLEMKLSGEILPVGFLCLGLFLKGRSDKHLLVRQGSSPDNFWEWYFLNCQKCLFSWGCNSLMVSKGQITTRSDLENSVGYIVDLYKNRPPRAQLTGKAFHSRCQSKVLIILYMLNGNIVDRMNHRLPWQVWRNKKPKQEMLGLVWVGRDPMKNNLLKPPEPGKVIICPCKLSSSAYMRKKHCFLSCWEERMTFPGG